MSDSARQPLPVTLRKQGDVGHKCECCSGMTNARHSILLFTQDVYSHEVRPNYASICPGCIPMYTKWVLGLVPGLPYRPRYPESHQDVVYLTFDGICKTHQGGALHDMWILHPILLKKGSRTGMVLTPCDWEGDYETVEYEGELCVPSLFLSLKKLRRLFPVPAH
jgi:hypothetical protein